MSVWMVSVSERGVDSSSCSSALTVSGESFSLFAAFSASLVSLRVPELSSLEMSVFSEVLVSAETKLVGSLPLVLD